MNSARLFVFLIRSKPEAINDMLESFRKNEVLSVVPWEKTGNTWALRINCASYTDAYQNDELYFPFSWGYSTKPEVLSALTRLRSLV